jgi:hypothetical protein
VSAAADGDEPPDLMTRLRDRIREVTGAYRDLVVVEHGFRAEGNYRAGDGPGYAAYGWGTRLTPRAHGQSLDFWYDGLDVDLVAAVGDVGWFEWRDLTDEDAVLTEAVGLCAGVLAGDAWEWRALCPAPGLMEALNPREDESHGGTEEVPRRAAGARDPAGGRRPA